MKRSLLGLLLILALAGQATGADYMTPEQIQRIWGEDAKEVMPATFLPRVLDFQDMIDQYAEASAFIRSLQYTASDTNFGGLMEAEHLLSIIQTDNTSEAIWIWCSPRPPPAPVMSTTSPGAACATPSKARTLVPIGQTASAASAMSTPSGIRMAFCTGTQVYSA